MRVGKKNSLVYQWAKRGSRPRQPKDQRYQNAYVFGAVCASRDTGVALIMVGAIITHVRLREPFGKSVPAIVLLLLAIFVAWGRFGAYAF